MVSEERGKLKPVVNIKIFKDGEIDEGIERQSVLHFRSQRVKESTIVKRVKREVDSTDKFS